MASIPLEERNTIAKNLVYLRKQRGHNQALVAERANLSLRTLKSAEVYGNPTARTLSLLSDFYKVPVSAITSEDYIETRAQYDEFRRVALEYYLSVTNKPENNHTILTDYITEYIFPTHKSIEQFLKSMGFIIRYTYTGTYNRDENFSYIKMKDNSSVEIEHLKYYPRQENETDEEYRRRLKKHIKEGINLKNNQMKGNFKKSKKYNKDFLPLADYLQKTQEDTIKQKMGETILVDEFNNLLEIKIHNAKRKYKRQYDEKKLHLLPIEYQCIQMTLSIKKVVDASKLLASTDPQSLLDNSIVGTYSLSEYGELIQKIISTLSELIKK